MPPQPDPSADPARATGPLGGVTVLEVSSVIMAPFAGRILAQLGADVIKLEPPGGDVLRRSAVPEGHGTSGTVLILNEGKRSIEVDARTEEGRDVLHGLVRAADVVLTNLLPRQRRRYGLDWEAVCRVNPQAILCTGQGYGSDTDLGDRPAYDDTIQAASGLCDVNRLALGRPAFAPFVLADKVSGMAMVYALLAALYRRSVDGQGQWVDVPMLDVMADFNAVEQLNDAAFDPPAGPPGWHRTVDPERAPQECADGWVCILPYTDRQWAAFAAMAERPELVHDARSATVGVRVRNGGLVQSALAGFCRGRTTAEVIALCGSAGVPCQEVVPMESLVASPYLTGRGSMTRRRHPVEGAYWSPSPGIRYSGTPVAADPRPAPSVDEHRAEILRELGE